MNNKPIGIFDSGLGGLTAAKKLSLLMPDENIIYFGDTGRMPYGGRPREQIRVIARQNIGFIEELGVKAVLAACGTISSNAADILDANPTKIIGAMMPGVEELAATGCERLGIIATKTSIESGAFRDEVKKLRPDADILSVACPAFVPMIESGHFSADDPVVAETVAEALAPVKAAGIQALLLGCTHYGIISDAIKRCLGENTVLICAADAAARAMQSFLTQNGMTADAGGSETYYTSGSTEDFKKLAPVLLGRPLKGDVTYIEPFALD